LFGGSITVWAFVIVTTMLALAQREADMVKAPAEKAREPGSVTQERLKELQKILKR
jgi:hypothetical protein